ncbi:hypothetical protein N1851_008880 [Merluccius polli]|uniref:Uncharacterized protein n=1 Tax=Merluccius polli TaxID=89951 RepID=A0AA47N1N0_MERPO|nr:hypothetical protein N1851_008880 [Merluccius polli]
MAALELPLGERLRRAERLEQSEESRTPPPSSPVRGRQSARVGRKRAPTLKSKHARGSASASKRRAVGDRVPQGEGHLEILAAIRGISERLSNLEAQHLAESSGSGAPTPPNEELPLHQEGGEQTDVLSLYAEDSLFEVHGGPERGGNTSSQSYAGSTQVETGDGEGVATDVLSTVLSAAKLVGLSTPVEAPPPAQGVWAGVSMPRPVVPAAPDYLLMLKRSWHNPAGQAQYNPGCRRLATGQVDPDSGLSDMPPVERDMAALTSLGPDRVTADPRCPVRECHKTDTLVCCTYNAAAWAARSGNVLAILLAATRRSVSLVTGRLGSHSPFPTHKGCWGSHVCHSYGTETDLVSTDLSPRRDAGRAASTVKVYAAAISAFQQPVDGRAVGKHPLVSQFIKGAHRLRPSRTLRAPSWDLPTVLQALTGAPYEPLEQADLKFVTQKTAFLLAVCSAKRVGELQALSVSNQCLRWKAN